MKIAILKERRPHEARVAASTETVKKFSDLGAEVCVEKGAGQGSSIPDAEFKEAGATIAATAADTVSGADIVLKVQRRVDVCEKEDELSILSSGQSLVCQMNALTDQKFIDTMARQGSGWNNLRISRAQSMDVLSSQSDLSGYKAVLDAASEFGRAFPMMMTAAKGCRFHRHGSPRYGRRRCWSAGDCDGTAIGCRCIGDGRPSRDKEQVRSLGATFVAVEDDEFAQAQTAGGYAKEMSDIYKEKQTALIAETIASKTS